MITHGMDLSEMHGWRVITGGSQEPEMPACGSTPERAGNDEPRSGDCHALERHVFESIENTSWYDLRWFSYYIYAIGLM